MAALLLRQELIIIKVEKIMIIRLLGLNKKDDYFNYFLYDLDDKECYPLKGQANAGLPRVFQIPIKLPG